MMSRSWSHRNRSQRKFAFREGHSHHLSHSHNRCFSVHTVMKNRASHSHNRNRSHKTSSHNRSHDRRPENSIAVTIAIAMRESRSQSRSRKFVTFWKDAFFNILVLTFQPNQHDCLNANLWQPRKAKQTLIFSLNVASFLHSYDTNLFGWKKNISFRQKKEVFWDCFWLKKDISFRQKKKFTPLLIYIFFL